MKVINKTILVVAVFMLAACSGSNKNLAEDNSVDYSSAKQLPEIKVPDLKTPETKGLSDSEQEIQTVSE